MWTLSANLTMSWVTLPLFTLFPLKTFTVEKYFQNTSKTKACLESVTELRRDLTLSMRGGMSGGSIYLKMSIYLRINIDLIISFFTAEMMSTMMAVRKMMPIKMMMMMVMMCIVQESRLISRCSIPRHTLATWCLIMMRIEDVGGWSGENDDDGDVPESMHV